MLKQLFSTFDRCQQPLYELSLVLPDETMLMKSINDRDVSFPSFHNINEEFVCCANEYSQKIAIELDEQSLTYSEVYYFVQQLTAYLDNCQNEIICQCVERSIEMVIGQLAIISSGAAYCPLSPNDSPERLASLITQAGARLIFVHPLTRKKFHDNFSENLVDIHHLISLFSNYSYSPVIEFAERSMNLNNRA